MATPVVYDQFKLKQHNGNAIDLDTDTIKVMLVTNSYTPSQAHDFINDANANEVSGTNYTAGGATIAGVTLSLSSDTVQWVHNDITWTQSGAGFSNARYAIWYKDTGNASTSPLIMYMSLGGADVGNVAGDLTLDGSASTGVLQLT